MDWIVVEDSEATMGSFKFFILWYFGRASSVLRMPIRTNPHHASTADPTPQVMSYDGGSHRGRAQYDVRHLLTPLVDPYHSSNSGTKFNLVLESSEDFTVGHIFVAGP